MFVIKGVPNDQLDLAPIVENDKPIVQEQEVEAERVADIKKPKKQKRPYIVTEAQKSVFKCMKQLRADNLAAKRALKDQEVEKNEEERPPTSRPAPFAPKEKQQSKSCAPQTRKTLVTDEEPAPIPPVTIIRV